MPFVDFIYGPPRDARSVLRPTTVDIDTVREMAGLAKHRFDDLDFANPDPSEIEYTVRATVFGIPGVRVGSAELDALSSYDRSTLRVSIERGGMATAVINFNAGTFAVIDVQVMDNASVAADIRRELEDVMLNNGSPIWRPELTLRALPLTGSLVFAALWVWLLAVTTLPVPAALLGWMVTAGVVAAGVRWSRQVAAQTRVRLTRHRILDESRATTFARRANERRDLKVVLWTAGITAALSLPGGFLLAVLTNAFGLKG